MSETVQIGVIPVSEHARRPRLWAALEAAYPVRFQGREPGAMRGLQALVAVGSTSLDASAMASLQAAGLACLLAATPDETPDAGDEPMAAMAESVSFVPIQTGGVFAPTQTGGVVPCIPAEVPCIPTELREGEALRERLRPGRCSALLALARFLRALTGQRPPPLHAAFVIDDPNLRRPRYGHIDYDALLADARRHGYHVAIAMVALDARLAHARAVEIFRAGARHLSLCVHGNDHDGAELGRPRSYGESLALVAQAARRVRRFERRTGLTVERVMVPPHERLCEPVARALHACGFDAVTTTRPYPWVATGPSHPWLARPRAAGPLTAWRPVQRVAGGLPLLLRVGFEHSREDLALRAFLGQPLILYGHHDLLAAGPGRLAAAAAAIERLAESERLGGVRWSSLATIARACAPRDDDDGGTPTAALALDAIAPPPRRLAPLVRRLATEGRDRAQGALPRQRC